MKCRHYRIGPLAFDGSWRCCDCGQAFEPANGFTGILRAALILSMLATAFALLSLVI